MILLFFAFKFFRIQCFQISYFLHFYMFSLFKKSHEATSQETKLIIFVAVYIFCVIMTETLGVKTSPV